MAQKKNGSKNTKGAAGAVKKAPLPKKALGIPEGWFFLTGREATVVDIRAALPEGTESDIWKEAGVLEVILSEEGSIDIETMEVDEDAAEFMDEQGAKSLFYVSFKPDLYEKALPVLKAVASGLNGKMLGDTPNLEPEIH